MGVKHPLLKWSERDLLLLPPTQGGHGSTAEVKKGFSTNCLGLLALSKMILPHQPADHKPSPSSSLWQASSTALQAPGREERSPRRCVRLLESCLGHQIPCCDPCATCYCRFFNAFCYCRKISTNFPCGKN
uniref:Agouti-related protein n=1 Tax=Anas platyrhynchos platyrhynchos TaxID=8840 RepID=U3IIP6_ANAPP